MGLKHIDSGPHTLLYIAQRDELWGVSSGRHDNRRSAGNGCRGYSERYPDNDIFSNPKEGLQSSNQSVQTSIQQHSLLTIADLFLSSIHFQIHTHPFILSLHPPMPCIA
jgi:hypothetical protein